MIKMGCTLDVRHVRRLSSFLKAQIVKSLPVLQEARFDPWARRSLIVGFEKMVTHSVFLPWENPKRVEESAGYSP